MTRRNIHSEMWRYLLCNGKSLRKKRSSDVDEAPGSAEIRAWSFKNVDFLLFHWRTLLCLCLRVVPIGRQNRSTARREKWKTHERGLPIIDQFNMYTEGQALHGLLHHAWASTASSVPGLAYCFIQKELLLQPSVWMINELGHYLRALFLFSPLESRSHRWR